MRILRSLAYHKLSYADHYELPRRDYRVTPDGIQQLLAREKNENLRLPVDLL